MQAAGWTVHDILLYQTPLQTIGKSLRFIFEIHNHIFSMNTFSYFIVNPVTIVSTLLLENRYTALNTRKMSRKVTGSQIDQQGRINLIYTTIPITTVVMFTRQHCYHSFNSVTQENGQCQLCYLLVIDHWIAGFMVTNSAVHICIKGTFCFHGW